MPLSQPEPPPLILADLIGDDENGRDFLSFTNSADPIDDSVRHMFAVERNTGSAVLNKGQRLKLLRMVNELTPNNVQGIVAETLRDLIQGGYVSVVKIRTRQGPQTSIGNDAGTVEVEFKNLVTGQSFTRAVKR